MPGKRRRKWASRNPTGTDRRIRRRGWRRRLTGLELLEDRRLLATLTVTSLADDASGGLTLREAVTAAVANDTIRFAVTGTINLTTQGAGNIRVTKSLTIEGPGANLLTIKAFDPDGSGTNNSNGFRVFLVDNEAGSLSNVTIRGLTLTNGDPEGLSDSVAGGAILNRENLTIDKCVITGNHSPNGGAIYSRYGTLSVVDTVITGNSSQDGGGILLEGATTTLTRVQLNGNTATNVGGGLLKRGGNLTVANSLISGNQGGNPEIELSGLGGGIAQYSGNLTIDSSTISGNSVGFHGGGIYLYGGNLTVTNSTISGNSVGVDANGGGIFSNTSNTIHVSHSTVTLNSVTSTGSGGGIHSTETAEIEHSIVAGNFRGSSRDDVAGSFNASFSLIGDHGSASIANVGGTSLVGTTVSPIDAILGPLANNAGRTMTHALLVGSPAIDSGNMSAVAGSGGIPLADQRGLPFSRVADGDGAGGARIDMGAYERQPALNLVVDLAADEYDFNYALGDLSLREALAIANGNVGVVDSISFSPALAGATILLSLGELPIADGVNITGLGANQLTIDASANDPTPAGNEGNGSRIFNIDDGAAGTFAAVQVSAVRITGGDVTGGGGGISNRENLTLTAVEIAANSATTQGGGIRHELGNLSIVDSLLAANRATAGGALWTDTDLASHTALVSNSTISGNIAVTTGGGIHNENGLTIVRHSTITNNSAAAASGGGIASLGDTNTRSEVHSTIVSANPNGDVAFVAGATNSFQSNNYNRVGSGNATGEFVESGDLNNVTDPMLGGLANNGGPTATHMPLAGSPAIDAGDLASMAGSGGVPQFDQRGSSNPRILNGRIDIGAVETLPPPAPALPGDYNLNNVVDAADYVLWRRTQGTSVPQYSGADGDGNGMVNSLDYAVWRAHFGEVFIPAAGSATSSAAPLPPATEPETQVSDDRGPVPATTVEPKAGGKSAMGAAFKKDTQSPSSAAALELLLALEPSASAADEGKESWSGPDNETADDPHAFDVAFADACDEPGGFVGVQVDSL